MFYWRITKYDPKNRDENGFYQKSEWTSVSDIGKDYGDNILTFESYLQCENLYINAILNIMYGNNVELFKMQSLQKKYYVEYPDFFEPKTKKYFKSLKNNMIISMPDIKQIIQFALREIIWCKLVNSQMFIHFGYDYYMYIGSDKPLEEVINIIEKSGLFVEAMISPYM